MTSLSIILPVYNEKISLKNVIELWDTALKKINDCQYHFLICEDGSTDGTKEMITDLENHFPIINLSVAQRRGYGQAIIDGIRATKSEYILCIDSDGQCQPTDFAVFWQKRARADFLIGWRFPRQDPVIRLFYSKLFFMFYKLFFRIHLHDPSCPYVLGNTAHYQAIQSYLHCMKEGFWWGFVGAAVKLNKSFLEIPIQHQPRFYGKAQVYRLRKMPGIILRNVLGLIHLRFM